MRNITLSLGFALFLLGNADAQPLPLRIEFKDMLFPDKDLGDKFKRFHAAAEKMAGPRWDRLPYECRGEYRGRGIYYADWSSFRQAAASTAPTLIGLSFLVSSPSRPRFRPVP